VNTTNRTSCSFWKLFSQVCSSSHGLKYPVLKSLLFWHLSFFYKLELQWWTCKKKAVNLLKSDSMFHTNVVKFFKSTYSNFCYTVKNLNWAIFWNVCPISLVKIVLYRSTQLPSNQQPSTPHPHPAPANPHPPSKPKNKFKSKSKSKFKGKFKSKFNLIKPENLKLWKFITKHPITYFRNDQIQETVRWKAIFFKSQVSFKIPSKRLCL